MRSFAANLVLRSAAILALGLLGGAGAAPGPIIVQAVKFTAEGGGKATIENPQSPVSPAYIHEWCTPGHWLEWTIDDVAAGDYQLQLRYGAKNDTAREIRINGKPISGDEAIQLRATGGWLTMKDFNAPALVTLKAGRNTLRITCADGESLFLSGIKLLRNGQVLAVDPLRFTGQGGGRAQAIVSDAHGFFVRWDDKGHALEWTIPAAAAGEYTGTMVCTTYDVPRRELKVNGVAEKGLESFTVPYTGGWRNWSEVELPAKVTLQEGRNVLRMTNIEGSLNVSYFRFSAPGKTDIIVNAIDFTAETGGKVQIHTPVGQRLGNWNATGHWLKWNVDAPAPGLYEMTLRIKPPTGPNDAVRPPEPLSPREIEVNGVVVKGLEAYVVPGMPPRDWADALLPVPVALKAGANELKITNLAPGAMELYEIRFSPVKLEEVKAP